MRVRTCWRFCRRWSTAQWWWWTDGRLSSASPRGRMSRMGIPSPTTSSTTTSPLAWSVFPVCGQWFYPYIIIGYYVCIGVVRTTHLMLTDSSHTWLSTTTPLVWSVPSLSCLLILTYKLWWPTTSTFCMVNVTHSTVIGPVPYTSFTLSELCPTHHHQPFSLSVCGQCHPLYFHGFSPPSSTTT